VGKAVILLANKLIELIDQTSPDDRLGLAKPRMCHAIACTQGDTEMRRAEPRRGLKAKQRLAIFQQLWEHTRIALLRLANTLAGHAAALPCKRAGIALAPQPQPRAGALSLKSAAEIGKQIPVDYCAAKRITALAKRPPVDSAETVGSANHLALSTVHHTFIGQRGQITP
jgi:hypothetical protein